MKKGKAYPDIDNILRLFSKQLNSYKGESRRGYQKAYSSFQIFVVTHYTLSDTLESSLVGNWVISNLVQGLTKKTVVFYLEKIASLYSGIASKIDGGKSLNFKEIKSQLKNLDINDSLSAIRVTSDKIKAIKSKNGNSAEKNEFLQNLFSFPLEDNETTAGETPFIWACTALKTGLRADIVKGIAGDNLKSLDILNLVKPKEISHEEKVEVAKELQTSVLGEKSQWFAMRLRPSVKFEDILLRVSLHSEKFRVPEFFYPNEFIARQVGRKMVWKGKPVIRDVVFFRKRKSEIFQMFTFLYDLAWCYRIPGETGMNYASIPDKAMENFKSSLGFLTEDFEIAPSGEMELKKGDEVVIVSGNYINSHGNIIKPSFDKDGNKIYRISLLNDNGHWDIGVDARFVKKL